MTSYLGKLIRGRGKRLGWYLLACGDEVIDELKAVHAELLGNGRTFSRLPVRDVRRDDHVVFDGARDADDTDSRPILRASLEFLQDAGSTGLVRDIKHDFA